MVSHTGILAGQELCGRFGTLLLRWIRPGMTIFLLTDHNTFRHCRPLIADARGMERVLDLQVPPGEGSKEFGQAADLWSSMMLSGAGRNSLMINLGGGVVSDLGGFLAAGFKRGIGYLNVPTTLIGMVDAAIGGKTALNLNGVKNQIGFFHAPEGVLITPEFLFTLPGRELASGVAELAKTALLGDPGLWNKLCRRGMSNMDASWFNSSAGFGMIRTAVNIKRRIVQQDFQERRLRKSLSFGHTIGHALEAWSHHAGKPLLHGEAVAHGLVMECRLAAIKCGLDAAVCRQVEEFLEPLTGLSGFGNPSPEELIRLMDYDKKNYGKGLNFSLLRAPGHPAINVICTKDEVMEVLSP